MLIAARAAPGPLMLMDGLQAAGLPSVMLGVTPAPQGSLGCSSSTRQVELGCLPPFLLPSSSS